MKILTVVQGTPDWNAARAKSFTASEASAMMGCHPAVKRSELLRMKATGDAKEYSQWVEEVLFARGHEVEALARPIAEKVIGEELYPCTATDDAGELLASFDGLTMAETICCEIKQWNEQKAAQVAEAGTVPECDYWQCIQQIAVAEAEKCLYVVSDGTEEGTVYCWLDRDPEAEAKLRAGWAQFQRDLEAYVPEPETAPKPEGAAPESLPALRIEVTGQVTASNLEMFREHAVSVIQSINRDLQTDQDFADAEQAVKWCKEVETRLAAAKQHALSQTESIDKLFRTLDDISSEARTVRLDLEKLNTSRKKAIREEILRDAQSDWRETVSQINAGLGKVQIPDIPIDLAGSMKNKRTIDSLRDAVGTALARAKIEAHQFADRIRANLEILRIEAEGYEHLFRDLQQLVTKPADDFRAQISLRIAEHKRAEEQRLEAERAKIREEEQRKAREEADAKARAEAAERERQERAASDAKRAEEEAVRQKPEVVRADVIEPEPFEPDATPEPKSAPAYTRPLMMRLSDWQQAHEISDDAMHDLLTILRNHTNALDMAA